MTKTTDPQSPQDCLAHCRDDLLTDDFRLAVALIELYATKRVFDAVNECSLTMLKAINERAPEVEGKPNV